MTNTELLKAPLVVARNAAPPGRTAVTAVRRATPDQNAWAGVKTLLEIGFAVVRVVEIAILFA